MYFAEIDAALDATRRTSSAESGQLRITLPHRAWQLAIAPRIAAFNAAYPDIELNFAVDEELTDIVLGGFHAGIRLGDYLADEMIAVALTEPQEATYVATQDYLAKRGTPQTPADLLQHDCIRYRQISAKQIAPWQFIADGAETHIDVTGKLTSTISGQLWTRQHAGLGSAGPFEQALKHRSHRAIWSKSCRITHQTGHGFSFIIRGNSKA